MATGTITPLVTYDDPRGTIRATLIRDPISQDFVTDVELPNTTNTLIGPKNNDMTPINKWKIGSSKERVLYVLFKLAAADDATACCGSIDAVEYMDDNRSCDFAQRPGDPASQGGYKPIDIQAGTLSWSDYLVHAATAMGCHSRWIRDINENVMKFVFSCSRHAESQAAYLGLVTNALTSITSKKEAVASLLERSLLCTSGGILEGYNMYLLLSGLTGSTGIYDAYYEAYYGATPMMNYYMTNYMSDGYGNIYLDPGYSAYDWSPYTTGLYEIMTDDYWATYPTSYGWIISGGRSGSRRGKRSKSPKHCGSVSDQEGGKKRSHRKHRSSTKTKTKTKSKGKKSHHRRRRSNK